MGGEPPNDFLDSVVAGGSTSPQQKRAAHRRLFHEMVKGELEAGALTSSRRRGLVRFARRLGIQPPEARLIIRAIEYAMGHVGQSADDMLAANTATTERRLQNFETVLRIGLALLLAVMYYQLARWVFRAVF